MATIVTRAAKGSPLTHNEVDANFTNLNTDKAETSALAAVATSGSYNDLSNTPAPFDPNTLATVATTGAYSDLTGKPTLGTAAATDATAYATAAQGSLADSALQGNQTITFSGDATGSGTTSIVVTVVDDSHNHIISNVDGLQTALDAKQPTGAYLTGNQTITLSGDLSGSGTTSISAQIAANAVNANELNVVGNGTATQFLRSDADGSFTWAVPTDTNTTYTAGTGLALTGTVFSNTITNNNQLTNGAGYITSSASISGNAATATKLQTARTINTVSFDGTANISLSLANLGYTGATNANYITNNNQLTNGAGYTTYTANQAVNTSSDPTFAEVYSNGWFRSYGTTGWYSQTYGGGIHMVDTTWVRVYNNKSFLCDATVQAATFNTTSDIKLKENVKTITGALDTVCALRGVTFDWIATKESTLGFIAQEVEKVVPELVSHNVEDDIKTVNYSNMVALLTEAVKELRAEIEELKKR